MSILGLVIVLLILFGVCWGALRLGAPPIIVGIGFLIVALLILLAAGGVDVDDDANTNAALTVLRL